VPAKKRNFRLKSERKLSEVNLIILKKVVNSSEFEKEISER
jgi:hypothetical protein